MSMTDLLKVLIKLEIQEGKEVCIFDPKGDQENLKEFIRVNTEIHNKYTEMLDKEFPDNCLTTKFYHLTDCRV